MEMEDEMGGLAYLGVLLVGVVIVGLEMKVLMSFSQWCVFGESKELRTD